MKAFRTYKAAKEAAKGLPILMVGAGKNALYVAFDHEQDPLGVSLNEVTLINDEGAYCGHVSMRHLDRLGNANYARAGAVPATERCFTPHDLGEPEPRPKMIRISPNVVVKA